MASCGPIAEVTQTVVVGAETMPGYEMRMIQTNKSAHSPPWGFSTVDFTRLGDDARRIQEETDDWADAEEITPGRIWKTRSPLAIGGEVWVVRPAALWARTHGLSWINPTGQTG